MKEIKKSISKSFGPVSITKEDIVILYNKLLKLNDDPNNKDSKRRYFHLQIDDFQLDSIDEIQNLKQKESKKIEFTYYTYDEYHFHLEITETDAWYFIVEPTPYILGICLDIDKILKSKKRKMMWTKTIWPLTIIGIGSAPFFTLSEKYNMQIFFYIGIILASIALISFALFFASIPLRKTKIILEENDTPFWKRNKDQILLNIFIFILGIIGTIIAQTIINK